MGSTINLLYTASMYKQLSPGSGVPGFAQQIVNVVALFPGGEQSARRRHARRRGRRTRGGAGCARHGDTHYPGAGHSHGRPELAAGSCHNSERDVGTLRGESGNVHYGNGEL